MLSLTGARLTVANTSGTRVINITNLVIQITQAESTTFQMSSGGDGFRGHSRSGMPSVLYIWWRCAFGLLGNCETEICPG